MAENDGQERTEEATPKRQQEAREKGQVPRSRELSTFASLMAAAAAMMLMGRLMLESLLAMMHSSFSFPREVVFDSSQMYTRFVSAIVDTLLAFAPFLGLMMVVGVAAAVALGGWSFSSQGLTPKLSKLDPIKGAGRIFSWKGLVEMVKGLAKFLLVLLVAIIVLRLQVDEFLGLGRISVEVGLAHAAELLKWSFLIISFALVVVVAIDVPFQLWDHSRQMKMTKQEIREEHKQTEGSPEVKGRLRRMQMEMAQRRMMAEVPKADVVITNPSHYAVALRYDQRKMDAPRLVAKGSDMIALKIRAVAKEHKVPVVEAPPLARAIFHSTELDRPIPSGLYRAVAQVLAYVYQLRRGPTYNRKGNIDLKNLEIPPDLRRDS